MIDVYAPNGAFTEAGVASLLGQLADALLHWTDAIGLLFARRNAGAAFHPLDPSHIVVDGVASAVVRITVSVPGPVLSTIERRRGFIADVTSIVAALKVSSIDDELTWVDIFNTVDGGWGRGGQAFSDEQIDAL